METQLSSAVDTIQRSAKKFFDKIQDHERRYNGIESVKKDLTSKLYDFYEPIDKLVFLYEVDRLGQEYANEHSMHAHNGIPSPTCVIDTFYRDCKYFIEQEIRELNPSFDFKVLRPNINSDLVRQNLVDLKSYPEAAKVFQQGMDKLNESRYDRNLLDDLRLSLEKTLRGVLKNDKALENQKQQLGEYLKNKNASKEFSNMFVTLLDYFGKYQNENVKHNDDVKQNEVEFIVNLTTSFIRCLINI